MWYHKPDVQSIGLELVPAASDPVLCSEKKLKMSIDGLYMLF
jgi:hypothetical protein